MATGCTWNRITKVVIRHLIGKSSCLCFDFETLTILDYCIYSNTKSAYARSMYMTDYSIPEPVPDYPEAQTYHHHHPNNNNQFYYSSTVTPNTPLGRQWANNGAYATVCRYPVANRATVIQQPPPPPIPPPDYEEYLRRTTNTNFGHYNQPQGYGRRSMSHNRPERLQYAAYQPEQDYGSCRPTGVMDNSSRDEPQYGHVTKIHF